MLLDEECKDCLYVSQMKKVEREQTDAEGLAAFGRGVKKLCENPPADYCAPLLMRDIDGLHKKIFGAGIDYSREKTLFNQAVLRLEEPLFDKILNAADPLYAALKYSAAANYIDFARLADLNESAVDLVMQAAERAEPDLNTYNGFICKLKCARTLCFLHDNCGEIVLDKILIRVIKRLYPQIDVTSVVRGGAIINDVTLADAEKVGLAEYARVVDSGANVPGIYLKETSAYVLKLLETSDVIIAKGLGNLETLYGEGYGIFYAFNCKCRHMSRRFGAPLWSAVFIQEK